MKKISLRVILTFLLVKIHELHTILAVIREITPTQSEISSSKYESFYSIFKYF